MWNHVGESHAAERDVVRNYLEMIQKEALAILDEPTLRSAIDDAEKARKPE